MKQGQTTTRGTSCPILYEKCVASLTFPANREDAYEKKRTSNHLQMSSQRQHILYSYFRSLSPAWGSNPRPPARQSGAHLPHGSTVLTSRTAVRCSPPARQYGAHLPHGSPVLTSRTAVRCSPPARQYGALPIELARRQFNTSRFLY